MPRTRSLGWATAAAATLAAALGCARGAESVTDYEVTLAVRRYNEVLPQVYVRGRATLLAETATPDEMRRIDDLIGFLAQGRMVMDARQESFAAGRVSHPAPARAQLEATEVWWYRHWIPQTGEVKQAPRRVRYRHRYRCVQTGGRWRVDRLEELGFEQLPLLER